MSGQVRQEEFWKVELTTPSVGGQALGGQGGALASKDTQGLQIPAGGPGHPLCLSSLRSSTCNARNYSKLSSPWDKLYMFSCCSLKSLHSLLL